MPFIYGITWWILFISLVTFTYFLILFLETGRFILTKLGVEKLNEIQECKPSRVSSS